MKNKHFLSVIIATFNRAEILNKTLESFCNLNTKGIKWELIVVDNNSSDQTKNIIKSYSGRLPIRYLFESQQGKNYALNAGIKIAKGDILVFTDDDVSPEENWLVEIAKSVDRWPTGQVFGGKVIPRFPKDTPEWVKASNFSPYVFAIHSLQKHEGPYMESGSPVGPNCWIRKELFDAGYSYNCNIGPKGTGRVSGSELELFTRLIRDGVYPIYVPSAVVYHRIQKHQIKMLYLLKRSFASGRGIIRIQSAYSGPKVFGIPRYLFRHIIEFSIKSFIEFIRLRPQKGFEYIMDTSHRIGCVRESWELLKSQHTNRCSL